MEDLSQTQVVLLCLLMSFVTSIGTGIITVSLLNEAPPSVTQTINRVVERTVETITPQPSEPNVITKEVTVVVKEEDLVIGAISNSRNSLVRIYKSQKDMTSAITIGAIVKRDGTILADKRFVTNGSYVAVPFTGGEPYTVVVEDSSNTTSAVYLRPGRESAGRTFKPLTLGNSDSIQLGQTVIAIGGKEREAVSIGRISTLTQTEIQDKSTTTRATSTPVVKVNSSIVTDAPLRDLVPGSILVNLNGQVVGFESYDSRTGDENTYTALNIHKMEFPGFFD
jgi:S1-C subfamily serine protease